MTTDTFRALCAELAESVEVLLALRPVEARTLRKTEDRLTRARAALADEPAVPEGREPAAVAGQLSDEELLKLAQRYSVVYLLSDGSACHPFQEGYDMRNDVLNFARAVLARWGNPAPPPADGEVAKSVAWLRQEFMRNQQIGNRTGALQSLRAAELLQRQALVPVPVSERLPGPGDCDAEGRCWWWYPEVPDKTYGYWAYEDDAVPERALNEQPLHWLPTHALPLPEASE